MLLFLPLATHVQELETDYLVNGDVMPLSD